MDKQLIVVFYTLSLRQRSKERSRESVKRRRQAHDKIFVRSGYSVGQSLKPQRLTAVEQAIVGIMRYVTTTVVAD